MSAVIRNDFREMMTRLPAILYFAYDDIRQQYKRTLLGPLWLMLGTCAYVFGFAFVMAGLFNQSVRDFLPHITIGMFVWSFLALTMIDGCGIFINASQLIHAMRITLLFHAARAGLRYLMLYLHYLVVAMVLMLLVGHHFTAVAFLALPGVLITAVAGLGLMLTFGTVNARYRDLLPMISVVCQLMPMVTPIAWRIDMLKKYQWVGGLNPFYHLIEVVRAPLLGEVPSQTSYIVASVIALGIVGLGLLLYRRARFHIIFWV